MRTNQVAGGLTPARVYAVAALWWLSAPLATAEYYEEELKRGSFPPMADTIIIGIVEYTAAWLLVTPAVLLLLWWCGWRAQSAFGVRAWDRRRPWRLVAGVGAAVFLIVDGVQATTYGVEYRHWPDAARGVLAIVLALVLRALISAPRKSAAALHEGPSSTA